MRLFKDGAEANVDKDQVELMIKSGWSRIENVKAPEDPDENNLDGDNPDGDNPSSEVSLKKKKPTMKRRKPISKKVNKEFLNGSYCYSRLPRCQLICHDC